VFAFIQERLYVVFNARTCHLCNVGREQLCEGAIECFARGMRQIAVSASLRKTALPFGFARGMRQIAGLKKEQD
jgi:hypothetical protein